jgi:hypothetical protein
MKKILAFIILIYTGLWSYAQPTAGTAGLLNCPSAEMPADGTFSAGANYLPDIVTPQKRFDYDTFNYYAGMAFLPFLELSFRMYILKSPDNELLNNQDRSLSVRMRIRRERKYLPAIVAGGNDIYSTTESGGSQYFKSVYIACTKTFSPGKSLATLSLGFAPASMSRSSFSGFFGGATFSPSFLRSMTLITDYDTQNINTGVSILLFRHLYLYGFATNFRKLSGGIALKLYARGKDGNAG